MRYDVLIVIPTYDERNNLRPLVSGVLDAVPEARILVVDDNSPDGTGRIAEAMAEETGKVDVLHRPAKLGLGTAYRAGFDFASERRASWVVTMDGDFSHHPSYIPDLLAAARGGADLVIGSRYVPGGSTPDFPLSRRMLSGGANLLVHWAVGLEARDATAGFRCYRREALEALPLSQIRSSGYSFLIEMLFLVQRAGFDVVEVPIVFEDRKHDKSKISRQEILRALATLVSLTVRRLLLRAAPGRVAGSDGAAGTESAPKPPPSEADERNDGLS